MKKLAALLAMVALIVAVTANVVVAKPVQTGFGIGMTSHVFKIGNGLDMLSNPSFVMVGTIQKPFGNNWLGFEANYVPRIHSWGRPWRISDDNRGEGLEINSSLVSGAVLVGHKWLGVGLAFNYMPSRSVQAERQHHEVTLGEKSWGYVVAVTPKIHRNLYLSLRYYNELGNFGESMGIGMESTALTVGFQLAF